MKESRYGESLVVKSASDDHISFSGYASVFDLVDNHNDIVKRGAFSTASAQNIKFLWQHDQTQPIGVITSLHEDDYGLYADATINSSTQQGREAIALVKQGAINGLSIGFSVKEADYNPCGQREITQIDLWEISLVTFPANNQAQLSHIKHLPLKHQLSHLEHKDDGDLYCLHQALDNTSNLLSQLNQI